MQYNNRSIRNNLRRMFILVVIAIFGLFLIGTLWLINNITDSLTEEYADLHSKELLAIVETELKPDVDISVEIAQSPEVIAWFENEDDLDLKEAAAVLFDHYSRLTVDGNIFVAIDASKQYYHFNVGEDDRDSLGVLVEDNEVDSWYFGLKKMEAVYDLNVDQDRFTNEYRLWVNVPVRNADGEMIGAIGTGQYLTNVLERMYGRDSHDEVETIIADQHGVIELAADVTMITPNGFEEDGSMGKHVYELIDNATDQKVIKDFYEEDEDGSLVYKLSDKQYSFMTIAPVSIGDWYVVAFYNQRGWFSFSVLLPLFILMAVLSFVMIVVIDQRTNKKVLKPYDTLIRTVTSKEVVDEEYAANLEAQLGDSYKMIRSFVEELTQRSQQLESEVIASNERLDRLYSTLSFGLFITDENFQVKYMNPYLLEILELNDEEDPYAILRNNNESFIYEEDRGKVRLHMSKKEETLVEELRLVGVNGRVTWVHMEMRSIKEGDQWIYECVVTNIELQKKFEERLLNIARMDELTKIYNRRYFNEVMEHEISNVNRYNYPLTIILYDIDKFKNINDMYGHTRGDEILIELATFVQQHIRENDILARWGGEEFAVILPHTDENNAVHVAEKLREGIESHIFCENLQITCSFGVAHYMMGETLDDLFRRTDNALYKAKNLGRNRVETYTSSLIEYDFETLLSNDHYRADIPLIDDKHKEMFEKIQYLIRQLYGEPTSQTVTVEEILHDIRQHFLEEEAIIEQESPHLYESHKQIHALLLEKLIDKNKAMKQGLISVFEFVAFMIEDVLLHHLINDDRQYMVFLKERKRQ